MQNLQPTGNERSVQVMNKKKYSSIWRVYVSELYRLFHKRSFWLAFMVLFLYAAADYLHTASWIIRGFVKEPYAASGYFMGAYQSFNKYQPIFIKVFPLLMALPCKVRHCLSRQITERARPLHDQSCIAASFRLLIPR